MCVLTFYVFICNNLEFRSVKSSKISTAHRIRRNTNFKAIPSIALRVSTAHDFRVISARISARARTKRKRFPSN